MNKYFSFASRILRPSLSLLPYTHHHNVPLACFCCSRSIALLSLHFSKCPFLQRRPLDQGLNGCHFHIHGRELAGRRRHHASRRPPVPIHPNYRGKDQEL